jgi:hypothetical protein
VLKKWKYNFAKVNWKLLSAKTAILWFHRQPILSGYLAPGDSFAISTPTWQYSLNSTDWLNFSVSSTSATLLSANSRIRFVGNKDYFGRDTSVIAFRACDSSEGFNGATSNLGHVRGDPIFPLRIIFLHP